MSIRAFSYRLPVRIGAIAITAFAHLWLTGCAGVPPPKPKVGYRADVTVETAGVSGEKSNLVHIVERYSMGKRRREMTIDGDLVVRIDRPDLHISWKLNPKTKSFEEERISSHESMFDSVPDPFGPRTRARYESIGSEIVDGVVTEKFSIEGKAISGYAWFTPDGIPFRFSGTLESNESSVEVEVAYTAVESGTQFAHFFGIPSTYSGYERGVKRPPQSSTSIDDAVKGLKEQQWGRQSPF